MKSVSVLFVMTCAVALLSLSGCGGQPGPLKKGVVTKVRYAETEGAGASGYFRGEMPENPAARLGGSYQVDMYGLLFPSHLELRFVGTKRVQIIPFHQIVSLEFEN